MRCGGFEGGKGKGKETLGWKRGSRRKGRAAPLSRMRDAGQGQGIHVALGEIGIGGMQELEVGGGHGENPSFPLGLCNFV